jgi:hypothetical protein
MVITPEERLSTQRERKRRREAVVRTDPGSGRSTFQSGGPCRRAKLAVAGPVH